MTQLIKSTCIKCSQTFDGVFPTKCPACGFDISPLAGSTTNQFQTKKFNEHSDLLYGRDIQLYGKEYNASFDFNGITKLSNLVRFALTFGDSVYLPARGGKHKNLHIVSYVPEIIGSGTSIFSIGSVPCSGLCLASADSSGFAHPYPVLDEWVQNSFGGYKSYCRICGCATSFAQPICSGCYEKQSWSWLSYFEEV